MRDTEGQRGTNSRGTIENVPLIKMFLRDKVEGHYRVCP
nr:MAG TPA: acetyl-coA carboxylase zinc finger domain protein [Caudoviricetes sp.]DAP25773.1 MAG TPA: acetyl-coA carboxylase zinc finger domain protein [Caudoviricetes sp.]